MVHDYKNSAESGPILADFPTVATAKETKESEIEPADAVLRQRIPIIEVADQSTATPFHNISRPTRTRAVADVDPQAIATEDVGESADQHLHYAVIILCFLAAGSVSLISSGLGILIGNVIILNILVDEPKPPFSCLCR